ncbi:MAG: UbiD family decarboxylase, partial [Mesorhizobium sp.]
MHYRLLPQFCDLGSFLSYLDAKGQIREIRAPVSTRFELTEIHKRVIAAHGPALRMTMPIDD